MKPNFAYTLGKTKKYIIPIFLFQIRLQIKRSVARRNAGQISFKDRDVDDVVDGYVACEPYKDSHVWEHSQVMERAMQVIYFLKSVWLEQFE